MGKSEVGRPLPEYSALYRMRWNQPSLINVDKNLIVC